MSWKPPTPSPSLPDPAICRGKFAGFGDYVDCLVPSPARCPYVLRFGFGYFCLHPERNEIVRRTVPTPKA